MHPKVRQAIEEIDAAVFNGDTFAEKDAHDRLTAHAEEWLRELKHEGVVARAFALGRRFSGVSVECRRDERQWPHPCRAYVVTSKAQRQEYAEAVYADTPELACAALLEQTAKLDAEARGVSVPLGKSQAASMAPEHQPRGEVVRVARGSVAYTVAYTDGIVREQRPTAEQLYPDIETCWKCGRDVKFGIRHGEHQCERVFLEERLRSFVGHVVNQVMVSCGKVTIDPVTLGEVAGRVAKMYVDDSDREYPKVEIDCDAMLRAMGRIRVTVWFTKRMPDDTTYDVAIVYPRMNGGE